MTEPAISVRNLSKCYTLGTIGHHTLVDEIQHLWHRLRGRDPDQYMGKVAHSAAEARRRAAIRAGQEEFWALRDVSFDIKPGEMVGVIGRNGAGKSTLLKLLTRITEPTNGTATINGRVASLLEVGTGFHPELTGRENIYMNGTILGMKTREIEAKFDEIVAFSELEQFIDTPVKRYSSGMYVRLAFAVAAHLEPEILLVDEVLAVGDVQFQRKCMGKMGEVAQKGRTILFVSHNLPSLINLCSHGLLLSDGQVKAMGKIEDVVTEYIGDARCLGKVERPVDQDKDWFIRSVEVGQDGQTLFHSSTTMHVRIVCVVQRPVRGAQLAFEFINQNQECIFCSTRMDQEGFDDTVYAPGEYVWSCSVPLHLYRAGRYTLAVRSWVPCVRLLDKIDSAVAFEIHDDASPIHRLAGQTRRGLIAPIYTWEVSRTR